MGINRGIELCLTGSSFLEEHGMDRRRFVWGIGSITALHPVFGRSPVLHRASLSIRPELELRNGSHRMALTPGELGYGMQTFLTQADAEHPIAAATIPIRVFYGPRSYGNADEITFAHASRSANTLAAWAEFKDSQGNRWHVEFAAQPCEHEGFRCRFDYHLLKGSAQDVFFEHPFQLSATPGTENTYVLMPGLL
jgi:hypothetical protein